MPWKLNTQLQLKTRTNVGELLKKRLNPEKVQYLTILVENNNKITTELKLSTEY